MDRAPADRVRWELVMYDDDGNVIGRRPVSNPEEDKRPLRCECHCQDCCDCEDLADYGDEV